MLAQHIQNLNPQSSHLYAPLYSPLVTNNQTILDYDRPAQHSLGVLVGLVVFYGTVTAIAIISNIFILLAFFRRLVPKNAVNTFLSSLAFSDFIMALLTVLDCVAFLQRSWTMGEWACKMQSFLLEVSYSASTLALVAVSLERFFLICFPHMKKRSMKSIYCYIVIVWISAFVLCVPLLDGYVVNHDIDEIAKTKSLVCANKGWSTRSLLVYYSIYSVITYIVPLITMAFAHWRISLSVKDSPQYRKPTNSATQSICYTIKEESSNTSDFEEYRSSKVSNGASKSLFGPMSTLKRKLLAEKALSRREKRIKAIRVLFVVTVTFFVLWSPFIFFRVIVLAGVHINEYIYKFSEVLLFSSTAVNGFIYAFMSPPFQKAFLGILCCKRRSEIYSRDSGPSYSNSEDNRSGSRQDGKPRGSISTASYAVESRNSSLLSATRKISAESRTAIL